MAEGEREGGRGATAGRPAPGDGGPAPAAGPADPAGVRPVVAAVLAVGGLLALAAVILDPPPEVRYGLVGAMGVLYFLSKVRHFL